MMNFINKQNKYVVYALSALALVASGDFFLPLVLALGLVDGALAITARATGVPARASSSILEHDGGHDSGPAPGAGGHGCAAC